MPFLADKTADNKKGRAAKLTEDCISGIKLRGLGHHGSKPIISFDCKCLPPFTVYMSLRAILCLILRTS